MNKKLLVLLLGAVLAFGGAAACKKSPEKPPAGTTPVDQLIAAGRAPVEVGNLYRGMNPVIPTFNVVVTNVSDAPVTLINGKIVFFDENGKALPEAVQEAGYTDISPIPPGGKIELSIAGSDDKAITGTWIIRDVLYEKPNPVDPSYGNLPHKWTNPKFEAELEAEKAK